MRTVNCTLVVDNLASTAIDKIWYDSKNRELYARYKGSHTISGYKDVSPIAVQKLLDASSIGKHFDQFIKKGGYAGIDTNQVSFNNLSAHKPKVSSWGGQLTTHKPAPTRYLVSGVVLMPSHIEEEVLADSLGDAVVKFRDKWTGRDPEVEGVRKA